LKCNCNGALARALRTPPAVERERYAATETLMNSAFSFAVLLEGMDKEPTILGLWFGGVTFGLLAFLAARWRRWAALRFLAVVLLGAAAVWMELRDPFVGPAILREAGRSYPWHLAISTGIASVLALAGMALPKRAA
jgi:hypothetical protein